MNKRLEKTLIIVIFFGLYFGIIYFQELPVFVDNFNSIDGSLYAIRIFDFIASLIIVLYISSKLIPSTINDKRILRFIVISFLLITILSVCEYFYDYLVLRAFNLPTTPDEVSDKFISYYNKKTYDLTVIPGNLIIYILAILYGLSKDWYLKFQNENILIREKMKADIAFLRSQINPHFFFNALNNIFSITQRNNDKEAGEAIVKLSGMMRYMLYESEVELISLSKEVENIANFIEISKLKYSQNDPFEITLNTQGNFSRRRIAPLIMLPFVENAIKHGIDSKGNGFVYIDIKTEDSILSFSISNSKTSENITSKKHSGIGLENVKKRLALQYPQKHKLKLREIEKKYSVELTLTLENNVD